MFIRRALSMMVAGIILFAPVNTGHTGISTQRMENSDKSSPIDPVGLGIKIANEAGLLEVSPDIVYNSIRAEYFAVWYNDRASNDDIWGQRVAMNGSLVGSPFPIASGPVGTDRRYPRVAYNSRSDQYLVVWVQHENSTGSSICGRRVSGGGVVLDVIDTVIRAAGAIQYIPDTPAVAYAYTSDKYLVIWSETWTPTTVTISIYGQIVLATGVTSGSRIYISEDTGGRARSVPELAYNLLKDQYLVVWQQVDPPLNDIWGRVLSASDGQPTADQIMIAFYDKSTESPTVASLPIPPNGQYLVAYQLIYNPGDNDIQGQVFSNTGGAVGNAFYVSNAYGVDETQPRVSASVARGEYLVAWKAVYYQPLNLTGIYGRLVRPGATVDGNPIALGGLVADGPHVVAGSGGDYLTIFTDVPLTTDVGIYGQVAGTRVYLPIIKR